MVETEIKLKLGDIIQIKSPTNVKYNLKYYLIEYINDKTIKLINITDGEKETIDLHEDKFIDTTITEIFLLSRSANEGYAKQHNLVPNTDVQLMFEDSNIVGKITNLEEDMIEIKTNDDQTIFIDFEYKGTPLDIKLKEISVIDDLTIQKSLNLKDVNEETKDDGTKDEGTKASIEFSPEGNAIIQMPENPIIDNNDIIDLTSIYIKKHDDDDNASITQKDVDKDLLDKLLKTTRDSQTNIHNIVCRFKELRQHFSTFDKNGNIIGFSNFNESYKPLVEHLDNLDTNMRWIIPVSSSSLSLSSLKIGKAKTDIETINDDLHFDRHNTGEDVSIKSVIMLPKPFLEFSRIDLPGTNILTKSFLSQKWLYYFKTLNNKTVMQKNKIDNVNEEYKFDEEDKDNEDTLIKTFDISPSLKTDYKTALQSIIPNGVQLINEKQIGYSLNQMIAFYEPYLIYNDTITYDSDFYKEIRKQIQINIKTYIDDYVKEKRQNEFDDDDDDKLEPIDNSLFENIKKELVEKINKEYRFVDLINLSTSEILNKTKSLDNGSFFMSIMSFLMAYLYTPELANVIKLTDEETPFTNSKSCVKRVIAKKYTSLDALQKDNGRDEVYFDKDYDTTPYDILKKHSEAQKKMNNEDFLDYLSVVLKNEYNVTENEQAESMAKTIILKKKPIEDGNYAVLIIYPKLKTMFDETTLSSEEKASVDIEADVKKRISYFIRKNDNWVRDSTMSDSDLNTEMLCNVDNKCFFDKNKEFCDIVENASERMKKIAKKSLKNEYETTIQLTMKDFEDELAKIYNLKEKKIAKIYKLQKYKEDFHSVRGYKLGVKAIEHEIVSSPYEKLRDTILSFYDFTKKQEYIVKFKNTFCREAVINNILDESIHWYYCKETNVKLLPTFLYKLAISQNDYEKTINEILLINGVKADGMIVDKFSGYVIQPIEIRQIEDNEWLEETKEKGIKREDNCIITPTRGTDQYIIYVVSKALCDKLDLDFNKIGENIISFTLRILTEDVSEIKYHANKLNHKTPFEIWKLRNIIIFTAAITFIIIQSHIPSLRSKNITPGCTYSLSGYPLEQSEDQSGLLYLSCILNELKNILSDPWIHVKKHTSEKFLKEMILVIKKNLLPNFKIKQMLENKRIIQNIVSKYVKEANWLLFQPPPIKTASQLIQSSISPAFKTEINESIKTANKAQHKYLGIMYKKIIEHTYSYVDKLGVDKLGVDKLGVDKLGVDKLGADKLDADKQTQTVSENIDFVKEYGQIYNEIKQLSIPPFIASKTAKTEINQENSKYEFSDNNIYSAYIHYCKLQCDSPIPDDLTTICQEKLLGLDTMNLEQAMKALDDNGKKQTSITLSHLMNKIAERNIVNRVFEEEQPLSFLDIEVSDKQDLVINHIMNALANKEKIDELENYLEKLNTKMLDNVKEYLNIYGRELSKHMKNKIFKYLENFENTKNISLFIKNAMYNITTVIPAKLNNNNLVDKQSGTSNSLNNYVDNANVCLLFDEINKDAIIKDINFIISQLVTITGLNAKVINSVYKYCYLSVFSQIISESKDDKYVKYNIEELLNGVNENEIEMVDNKHDFYNDISYIIYVILDRDMQNKEFLSQVYKTMPTASIRCKSKKDNIDEIMQKYKLGIYYEDIYEDTEEKDVFEDFDDLSSKS
jgi:hypothetical protein